MSVFRMLVMTEFEYLGWILEPAANKRSATLLLMHASDPAPARALKKLTDVLVDRTSGSLLNAQQEEVGQSTLL